MALHVVVGAGPTGGAIARDLIAKGEDVRVLTRSGSGPDGAETVAADIAAPGVLRTHAAGAQVIYNAVNPPYHRWPQDWPPLAAAFLDAAADSGAVLAMIDNLYAFGPVDVPMSPKLPDAATTVKGRVRARMWADLLAAQAAGRVRAVVAVRGSDYLGEGPSMLSILALDQIRRGTTAFVPADLDAPHAFTNPGDAGRLLVKAAADPRGWNRYWLVPSEPAISFRALAGRAAELLDVKPAKLRAMPGWVLRAAGLFSPMVKEVVEMDYQFRRPFLIDASETVDVFGDDHTSLDDSLRENLGLAESAAR